MAERYRYLLMYDIRNPGRLRRVHEVAVDHGERLQYSVYVCDLTRQELVGLRQRLRIEMNQREDSISLFDLGPVERRHKIKVEHLGRRGPAHDDRPESPAVW
jgi:CRISPR-associated protein Cas2